MHATLCETIQTGVSLEVSRLLQLLVVGICEANGVKHYLLVSSAVRTAKILIQHWHNS